MINLKIYEENNNLIFKENYPPIVCGNSNYEITFEFGSDWQSVSDKTAIIIVGGKKTAKDFSGSTLTLPAIPNCNNFMLIIFSSEGETTRLVSSPIEIEATPTSYAESLPEFEPLTTYVSELLTKINNLIDGTTKVKTAEKADIATSAQNVSNPNLLLNGDFKINQRGKTSYVSDATIYTVDRWKTNISNKNISVTVTPQENGILLTYTSGSSGHSVLMQELETSDVLPLKGKILTLSYKITQITNSCRIRVMAGGNTTLFTETISESGTFSKTFKFPETATGLNVRIISNSAENTVGIEYIKIEIGSSATAFCPRPQAEELALCQRYYQAIETQIARAYLYASSGINFYVPIPVTLRTLPTLTLASGCGIQSLAGGQIDTSYSISIVSPIKSNTIHLRATKDNTSYQDCVLNLQGTSSIDAEIY